MLPSALLGTATNRYRLHGPLVGTMLGYSLGGVAEMSLIALSLGIEVPFVVFHHIVRVLLVLAGSAAIFALGNRAKPK